MDKWKQVKYMMEDALECIIDYRGKTPRKSNDGIETLSAKSVKMGFIDYSNCYYISHDEYKRFMVRGFPKKGDILLTTEAPLGMVARLDKDNVAIAQRLLTLRGKQGVLDNNFLLYYLQSSIGQGLLKSRETGTTVTGIKQAEFRKIEIEIPPFPIQQQIAGVLSVLDSKIENNTKINHHLPSPRSATDSSPDIRRGKSVSRNSARLADSCAMTSILRKSGRMSSSNCFNTFSPGYTTGKAFSMSVFRLVNTLPLPKATKSSRMYLKNRYRNSFENSDFGKYSQPS